MEPIDLTDRSSAPGDDAPHLLVVDDDTRIRNLLKQYLTENGFRVMFLPHRDLMPEGPAQLVLTIDDGKPLILGGDAFGDQTTDVVTVHDSDRIQAALSRAHHEIGRASCRERV